MVCNTKEVFLCQKSQPNKSYFLQWQLHWQPLFPLSSNFHPFQTVEASLYFLLKDSDSRPELVARFMGILELIKIRRILITNFTVTDDVIEYDSNGLEMMFKLNPDYIPIEGMESEFDIPDNNDNEEVSEENE